MATILDGMNGGKHNSDNVEHTDDKPTFEIVLRFTDIDEKNPLDAVKKILEWIKDDASTMIYEVKNEITNEKWTVDLSEDDEDAVLPDNE
jgi:hypothetical protein